jgi:hydrogenase-1 operon protein HyaE
MTYPLIERLTEDLCYPQASVENLAELIAHHEILVLFFAGNPDRFPESLDVAVILPELINSYKGRLTAATVAIGDEEKLRDKYHFNQWPSLVFLRRGVHIGTISKVKDWSEYLSQINQFLETPEASTESIPTLSI